IELQLLTAFLWLRDRNEIAAGAAALDDFVCDALIFEPEMTTGLDKRRIEDGVIDDDLCHGLLTGSSIPVARRRSPQTIAIKWDRCFKSYKKSFGPKRAAAREAPPLRALRNPGDRVQPTGR